MRTKTGIYIIAMFMACFCHAAGHGRNTFGDKPVRNKCAGTCTQETNVLSTEDSGKTTHKPADTGDTKEKKKKAVKRQYIYRFTLKDKSGNPYSLSRPEEFLSRKSIERRRRQKLPTDSTDMPVSTKYIDMLSVERVKIIGTSRWHNTVLLSTSDTTTVQRLARMNFVRKCEKVYQSPDSIEKEVYDKDYHDCFNPWDTVATSRYGVAESQIAMLNGSALHEAGYEGQGVTIAVLDGGFRNADRIPAFENINIIGAKDFISENTDDIYRKADHGTKVLSAMGVNAPYVYTGTAPQAGYWLLRCEDIQTEQPVEEDYWTMAAEFADSVGADIINSSLGYTQFDRHLGDHRYRDMDGHTAFISQSASMLADKGMILITSAGNSGMGPWKKIVFPADAENIITVGAVTPKGMNAPFCGVGPTQDGRTKPDVMAQGSPAAVISGRGTINRDMGTSFSTPVVCGLTACLWQALPGKTAKEIMDLVRRSADNTDHPDNIIGYGIPDFGRAYDMGRDGLPQQ